jgi:hypothetical protein
MTFQTTTLKIIFYLSLCIVKMIYIGDNCKKGSFFYASFPYLLIYFILKFVPLILVSASCR